MNEGKTPFREASIPISQLLLDIKNPRFPEIEGNQRDAIRAMVQIQGEKIIALANHILDNGPNPANLLIVMPATNDAGNFVVLDGNRRFTALKLLETPTLIEGVLNGKALQRLKRMSSTYKKQPLTEMRCIVFNSRDEADTWIQLTHRGYQSGAGLVEWDGQVAARYDSRKGDKSAALQVLDFVKDKAPLSEKTRAKIKAGKFPITNLERLINTPYVRKKLGIDVQEDKVVTSLPDEEVLKGLARVIEDLGSGEVTVSNIKSQAQRIDYINSLNHTDLPQADSASGTLQPLGATVASGNEAGRTPVAAKPSSGRIGVQKRCNSQDFL